MVSNRTKVAAKARKAVAYPPPPAGSEGGMHQIGPATVDAFLPLLVALAVAVLAGGLPLRDAEIAAGAGVIVALYRLWTYTPWAQRKYTRSR